MSAKYKSPSFLLPNELNTDTNPSLSADRSSMYSMDFDGASYINLGNSSLNLTANSISIWFKTSSTTSGQQLLSKYGSTFQFQFRLETNGTITLYSFENNTTYATLQSASGYNDGNWHNVITTFNTTDGHKMYVDGNTTPVDTDTANKSALQSSSERMLIGARDSSTGVIDTARYFTGQIDEVAIFNKSLNSTDVSALYNSGSPAAATTVLNLGASAYYPLGEQAQNTGYLGNEITNGWQFPNGVLQDYVMDFDGVNDFIGLNANNSFGFGTGDFTISMWLYREAQPSYPFPYILDFRESSAGTYIQDRLAIYYEESNGKLRCYISGGDAITGSTGTAMPLNQWFNLILTRSSGTLSYYVNGSVDQSVSNSTNLLSTNQANLGRRYDNDRYFNGKISNLAIWNSSAANIANIYNNGSPQTSYTVAPQNWWKLNADSVYTPSAPNYTTALDFVASQSDDIDVGMANFTATNGTISLWFNPTTATDTQTNNFIIGRNAGGNNAGDFGLLAYSSAFSGFAFYMEDGTNSSYCKSNSNFAADNWVHFAVTWQSGVTNGLIMYINGVAQSVTGNGLTLLASAGSIPINIGGNNGTSNFNGKISNTAIFNSALTASQVSTLFNFGTPETAISFSPQAWWKLDNTTTGIQDSSGNGNNGTNNGAAQVNSPVAVVPSWKIPTALTIQTPSYTQALDFNNGSGYTDSIAYGSSFSDAPSASGAHTFSLWFKQDALNSNEERLFATKGGWGAFAAWIQNGILKWSVYDGSNRVTSTSIQAGIWYNVVFGVNGSNEVFLYLNNGSKISTSYNGTISYNSAETGIYLARGRDATNNRSLNGQLSNFAWFNYVLPETGTESIESIYNLGTPKDITGWSNNYLWYKLNSLTITDSSGNNRTGVNSSATLVSSDVLAPQPVNGVSTTLPSTALQQSDLQFDSPYSNYSLYFDGASYIDCGNDSVLTPTNGISISLWLKTSDTANYRGLIDKWNSSTGYMLHLGPTGSNQGKPVFAIGGQSDIVSSTAVNDGNWHHITVTCDNTTGYIYVDGVQTGTGSLTMSGISNSDNLRIADGDASTFDLNGKMDETSMFNYALSSAQVLEIYNNGRPKDLTTFSGTAPISWWRLGENAYFNNNTFTVPNSITGAPNGIGAGTVTSMISADAPGTYANGIGTDLDIVDRIGDASLSTANSQSYNMIPDDKVPYVPGFVGLQTTNAFEMTFDGTNDYMSIGTSSDLNFERTDSFSISAWININTLQIGGIFSKDVFSPLKGYNLFLNNSIRFYLAGTGSIQINGSQTLSTSQWYHIAVTYDGSSNVSGMKLYVDGVEDTSTTASGTTITGSIQNVEPPRIGVRDKNGSSPDPRYFFSGNIDEVAVFDKVLTADQVKFDLYNATTTGKTADIANNPNLPTPVAWYRMGD